MRVVVIACDKLRFALLERFAVEKGNRSGGRGSGRPRRKSLKTTLFRRNDGSAAFEIGQFQKQNALRIRKAEVRLRRAFQERNAPSRKTAPPRFFFSDAAGPRAAFRPGGTPYGKREVVSPLSDDRNRAAPERARPKGGLIWGRVTSAGAPGKERHKRGPSLRAVLKRFDFEIISVHGASFRRCG